MFMYILIFMICVGVGVYLSRKIDENWEDGLYDHLYYDDEEDYVEPEEVEEYTESDSKKEVKLKDLDDEDTKN